MKRRTFIRNTGAATAGLLVAPHILKSKQDYEVKDNNSLQSIAEDNVLIIIELFGGNDGLNTIIPAENDTYYSLRPNISIPVDKASKVTDIYMNKALIDGATNGGMKTMFESGRLAIVEGIGYDSPNMSHFRSEDIWLSGVNPKSNNSLRLLEGWLGKYYALKMPNYPNVMPAHPISVSIDGTIPLIFKSSLGDMGISLTDPIKFKELGQGLTPKLSLFDSNTKYYNREFNFVHTIAKQSDVYANAVFDAYETGLTKINSMNYSSNPVSQKLKMISALIAGGLQSKVYFLKLSNFDSHAQQMTADYKGQHYTLLNQLATGISEFMDDTVSTGFSERVIGMTMSEFGRRAYDNGSRGTDHGAASMQFVFGDDKFINGGYWNNRPNLDDLDSNGNIKYQTDYRVIYAEIMEKWLGATSAEVEQVFGEPFLPLNIIEQRNSSVDEFLGYNDDFIQIAPNPNFGSGLIKFELKKDAYLDVIIFNIKGKEEYKLAQGKYLAGQFSIPFNIESSGNYICSVSSGSSRHVAKIIVNK